jgi:hypothetical protein
MFDQNWQHSTTSTCGTLASSTPSSETWCPFFVSHFGPKTGRRVGRAVVFLISSCKMPTDNLKYGDLYPSNQSDLHADYRTQNTVFLYSLNGWYFRSDSNHIGHASTEAHIIVVSSTGIMLNESTFVESFGCCYVLYSKYEKTESLWVVFVFVFVTAILTQNVKP